MQACPELSQRLYDVNRSPLSPPQVLCIIAPDMAESNTTTTAASASQYKRVLMKVSGEGLCEEGSFGIRGPELEAVAQECVDICRMGVQLAIVVGGGNFIRGSTFTQAPHVQRATADYMGMLATVINALALQETMEGLGQPTRVMSAINIASVCEPFIRRRAIRHLEKGRAIVLAAGTGNPFFTTDTCAALRAAEIHADVLLKATKVDGIYTADPKKDPTATRFDQITYHECLTRQLKVMDQAAFSLAMERKVPIVVFNAKVPGNIGRVIRGENVGTRVVP